MQLLVIVYVNDMERSGRFYESIGFRRADSNAINAWWNAFTLGDARLALHHHGGDPLPVVSGRAQINLDLPADGSLDRVYSDCTAKGLPIGAGIDDVGFGRSFWVNDPDGLPIQFNERSV